MANEAQIGQIVKSAINKVAEILDKKKANKGANVSSFTNDAGYKTSVTQSDVTQHQGALQIAQSQVTNLTTDLGNKADKNLSINTQTASYILVLDDAGKLIEMDVATANDLTVPANATVAFPVGTEIAVEQYGAGQTTFVADAGVTIRSAGGNLKLTGQYSAASLIKRATDEWLLIGDLSA